MKKRLNKFFYPNTEICKFIIFKENNKKSGIYKWNNLITGKSYVGSAINLTERLKKYFSPEGLKKNLLKSRSLIHSAILKYGYFNFSLEILEYCEPCFLIEREQYYIDLLNPEYNICKIAGSTIGKKDTMVSKEKISLAMKDKKLSMEALFKLKGRKYSVKTRNKISAKLIGRKCSLETIAKLKNRRFSHETIVKIKLSRSHMTIVINIKDNSIKKYYSIREAAGNLGVSHTTVRSFIKKGILLKKTFLIKKGNSVQ